MVIALARYTGWGLTDLMNLTEEEITLWFEAALEHRTT